MGSVELVTTPVGVGETTFRNVIAAAYAAYIANRGTPSVEQIYEFVQGSTTKQTISKIIVTPEFIQAIRGRGVWWPEGDDKAGLSPQQVYLASILTNPADRRDLSKKLKTAGVSMVSYKAWLKQPHFANYMKRLADDLLSDHIGDVHTALTNQALGGNVRAIELYYQIAGVHDPAKQQSADLMSIIQMLLEVLTKHITDPQVLDAISSDIGTVIQSQVVRKAVT